MEEHPQFAKFIDRTFYEVLQLLEDARDYTLLYWKEDKRGLAENDALRLTQEKMLLTARLSEIMAWLMVQKAVNEGEMTARESQAEAFRLNGPEVYRDDALAEDIVYPDRFNRLLEQNHELYERVSKMDRMAARLFALSY